MDLARLTEDDEPALRLIVTTPYKPFFQPQLGEYVHHTETPFGSLERITDKVTEDDRHQYQFVWFTVDTVKWENPNPISIWTSFEK